MGFRNDSITVVVISTSFVNQDLTMYTIRKSYFFFTYFDKLKYCHHFIVQRAVKARIIANGVLESEVSKNDVYLYV